MTPHRLGRLPDMRVATAADLGGIARTLALAFEGDPLWRWAFREPGRLENLERWWRFYIENALR